MNHNPHNLKVGDIVILDAEFDNSNEVIITEFSPNNMFATICDNNNDKLIDKEWTVMTSRLTPKPN